MCARSHHLAARAVLAVLLIALGTTVAGRAENLLANPGFDTGLQPWRVDFPQVHFAGPDVAFDPDSGSMQIDLQIADPQGAAFAGRQCVVITGGAAYEASAFAALLGPDQPRARVFLEVGWHAEPGCTGAVIGGGRLAEAEDRYQFWIWLQGQAAAPPGAVAASFRIGLEKLEADGDFPVYALFDGASLDVVPPSSACVPDAVTLCLRDGRFRVTATWQAGDGSSGAGFAHPLTADTGAFWFFDAANLETFVKVLDGCAANQHFWVYAGGLTDLGVTLAVEDTLSGATALYESPLGAPFRTVADVEGLAGCP